MTTIQDVAGDLGLSAMTVSRALNGHPDADADVLTRVNVGFNPGRVYTITARGNINDSGTLFLDNTANH